MHCVFILRNDKMISKLRCILQLKHFFSSDIKSVSTRNLYISSTTTTLYNKAGFQNVSFEDKRIQKHLDILSQEYKQTEDIIKENKTEANPSLMQRFSSLSSLIALKSELEKCQQELAEINCMITEFEKDADLMKSALKEKEACLMNIKKYESSILSLLIPQEYDDDKAVIMELSAGVGGQEAMLFTKDLFDMYHRYAIYRGWESSIHKYDETDIGGLRTAHLAINGLNVYKYLKFEAGVHRVQRIPKTEKNGRIHTSTTTVAVLPQPSEIDIVLNPKDIKTEMKNSSGAGGQNVNKNATCVRLVHLPTGITVESQTQRFQHLNRAIAFKTLRARLYQRELEKSEKEQDYSRKLMVGTAARSDKVRTYNYPQDRVTDHRINVNMYNIDLFMQGQDELDKMFQSLQDYSALQKLDEILEKYKKIKQ